MFFRADREAAQADYVRRRVRARTFFRSERERWQAEYVRHLAISDTLLVFAAVFLAQLVRFGGDFSQQSMLAWAASSSVAYTVVSGVLALLWVGFLALFNTRSPRVVGGGAEEYQRIASATFRLFGVLAIAALLLHVDIARGYLAIAFPLGLTALLANRRFWRGYARKKREHNKYQTSVLVVGARHAVPAMADAFARDIASGYHVVGACTPEGPTARVETIEVNGRELPIVGLDHEIVDAVKLTGADTVALTATEHLRPEQIKRLVWSLEALGVDLIVTPGLVDIAGQRLRSRPVASMPMLHIEKPQYDRAKSIYKQGFDFLFASCALLAVLPVMVIAAVAIKCTSRGPVFYKSERMGLDGQPFEMVKFRSMFVDADKHLAELVAQSDGNGMLFKMKDDPRVTSVGKILRRYSIDELPQFINVLRGDMSVVGPRPPLRSEVERYDVHVRRRMLVKPGITGLWQVSGRSDLSWEETVRLDVSYVENWSMLQDLLIIKQTLRAVTRSDGAY